MRTNTDNRRADDEIDLHMLFYNIRRKWYYFPLSFFLVAICVFIYIRFTLPVYEATSSILIKDSKNSSKNIEDVLTGDVFGNSKNISTEIGILQSGSVLEETFRQLNLGISYFSKEGIICFPIYKTVPFNVRILNISDGIYDENFNLTLTDSLHFKLLLS